MEPIEILLVDDNESLREELYEYLKYLGCIVTACEDGKAALTKFKGCHFDLVITDCEMPVMNGIELVREIRNLSATPILMMTGLDSAKDVATQNGVNWFFLKPFNLNELEVIVLQIEIKKRLRKDIHQGTQVN